MSRIEQIVMEVEGEPQAVYDIGADSEIVMQIECEEPQVAVFTDGANAHPYFLDVLGWVVVGNKIEALIDDEPYPIPISKCVSNGATFVRLMNESIALVKGISDERVLSQPHLDYIKERRAIDKAMGRGVTV